MADPPRQQNCERGGNFYENKCFLNIIDISNSVGQEEQEEQEEDDTMIVKKKSSCFFLVVVVLMATLTGRIFHDASRQMFSPSQVPVANRKQQQTSSNCNHLVFDPDRDWNCPVTHKSPLVGHGPATCPPNYFIAGTRKGGTTSLHIYLTAHSDIFRFKIKGGPADGEVFEMIGSSKYTDAFRDVPKDLIVGDASVSRLVNEAEALSKHCQHARILVLLRDPVERCFSQMMMRHRMGTLKGGLTVMQIISKEMREFEKVLQRENSRQQGRGLGDIGNSSSENRIPQSWYERSGQAFSSAQNCLYEGAYIVHLRRLLRGFPQSQVRIYWSEDFFNCPEAIVRDALAFIGSDPSQVNLTLVTSKAYNTKRHIYNSKRNPHSRKNNKKPAPRELDPLLRAKMKHLMEPFDLALARFLGVTPPWLESL